VFILKDAFTGYFVKGTKESLSLHVDELALGNPLPMPEKEAI
jgi:hypothetical protein